MQHRAKTTQTLGILGGGQLAMLICLAAKKRRLQTCVYLPSEEQASVNGISDQEFIGSGWEDKKTLLDFAQHCSVIALENEFVPFEILKEIQDQTGVCFVPDLNSYRLFQNKKLEKQVAQAAGLLTVPWRSVESLEDVQDFLNIHKSLVLKTASGGYDGHGNLFVDHQTSPQMIEKFLAKKDVLAEAFIHFKYEVAIVVARAAKKVIHFPIAQTIQKNHICHFVIAPASIPKELEEKIVQKATLLIESVNGVGLFGIEFFVTQENQVFYNETAPRPHNSAHFTIDACSISQFEAIIDLAFENDLKAPTLTSPVVGMLNLLGTHHGPAKLEPKEDFDQFKNGQLCLYGKPWSRPGRKMGHFNLKGEVASEVLSQLSDLQLRYQL
ncbi:MAG: ATP-grasp domain-containing protein [Bacteriovoracaceae bacterium]|nr:ATP-grasp domain-containing protein [Bacteriovoracaceae bacterium]